MCLTLSTSSACSGEASSKAACSWGNSSVRSSFRFSCSSSFILLSRFSLGTSRQMNAIGPSKPGHTDCLPCSDQFLLRGASNRDFIGLCSEAGAGVQPGWTAVPNPVVAALLCHSRGDQILCADYLLPLGNLGHGDASGSQQYP